MKQFEELQPFFMRMSLSGPMQNLAVQIVQRSKQGKGSVPFVVMGLPFECALLRVEDRAGFVPRPGIGSFRRNRAQGPGLVDRGKVRSHPRTSVQNADRWKP